MNPPEGWPTDEMIDAAYREIERIDYINRGEIYRAVKAALAAAPTPPEQEDEPIKIPEVIAYKSTAIPESQWESRPVDEWLKWWLDDCDYHESLVYEAIIKFCESIRNANARPADDKLRKAIGEHLAFVHRDGGHHQDAVGIEQAIFDATEVMLADRQQFIEMESLRKAAEEASDLLDSLTVNDEFDRNDGPAIAANLRAELKNKETPDGN